ncbi:MAG: NUDIX hydrolase [Clostridia bacterium]|nr:NUDIX hydrolase [Clostridia bacterium]
MDEKSFLSEYSIENYERPSVTTDIAVFALRYEENENYRLNSSKKLSILLIKRGEYPFKGMWALPGGFLRKGETVEECAVREIFEETSVKPLSLISAGVFSKPDRDPRGWIISNAFASVIGKAEKNPEAGDDAADAQWFDVTFERTDESMYRLKLVYEDTELLSVLSERKTSFGKIFFEADEKSMLAFDHAEIIASSLAELRQRAKNFDVIFDFLPEKFTLTELQSVQEAITNISVTPANFRRKISGYVSETDEYTQGDGHRPARLYKRNNLQGACKI